MRGGAVTGRHQQAIGGALPGGQRLGIRIGVVEGVAPSAGAGIEGEIAVGASERDGGLERRFAAIHIAHIQITGSEWICGGAIGLATSFSNSRIRSAVDRDRGVVVGTGDVHRDQLRSGAVKGRHQEAIGGALPGGQRLGIRIGVVEGVAPSAGAGIEGEIAVGASERDGGLERRFAAIHIAHIQITGSEWICGGAIGLATSFSNSRIRSAVDRDRGVVVGTGDADGQNRYVGLADAVSHCVVEALTQRAAGTEGLNRQIVIVNAVGVSAIRIEGEFPVLALQLGAQGSSRAATLGGPGAYGGHRRGVNHR